MKKLAIMLALTTLAASPAFAQNMTKRMTAKNAYQANNAQILSDEALTAYAFYPGNDVVIESGEVLGRDPDPNVRLQLRRDSNIKNSAGGD